MQRTQTLKETNYFEEKKQKKNNLQIKNTALLEIETGYLQDLQHIIPRFLNYQY